MSLLRDGWALALMVVSLLFVPQEQLSFWFVDRPQDWYGELVVPGPDRNYILVKNQGRQAVDLLSEHDQLLGARASTSAHVVAATDARALPPGSYVLVASEPSSLTTRHSRRFAEGGTQFIAPQLYVMTEAEDDVFIILLFLGALLLGALGFSIGLFAYRAAAVQESSM